MTLLLHSAAADGLPGLVKLLLSAGASPNFQASDGCTPVMLAALHGKASAAAALAAVDADLDIANNDGQTPLHFAVINPAFPCLNVCVRACVRVCSLVYVNIAFGSRCAS